MPINQFIRLEDADTADVKAIFQVASFPFNGPETSCTLEELDETMRVLVGNARHLSGGLYDAQKDEFQKGLSAFKK